MNNTNKNNFKNFYFKIKDLPEFKNMIDLEINIKKIYEEKEKENNLNSIIENPNLILEILNSGSYSFKNKKFENSDENKIFNIDNKNILGKESNSINKIL